MSNRVSSGIPGTPFAIPDAAVETPCLTIMIGTPDIAESDEGALRRALVRRGYDVRSAEGHLRGVRRLLVRSPMQRTILCIALDDPGLAEFGDDVCHLIGDLRSFGPGVRAVGLVRNRIERMSYGCDLYVADDTALLDTIERIHPQSGNNRMTLLHLPHRCAAAHPKHWSLPLHRRLTWISRIPDES